MSREDFDRLLVAHGLDPFGRQEDSSVVVIGRGGWTAEALDGLVRTHQGMRLRVYSQEMFLCYLATGLDPLDAPADRLAEFIEGHPALDHIEGWGFPWPTTVVLPTQTGTGLDVDRPEKGWLSHLGYTTGVRTPGARARREALRDAFTKTLPLQDFDAAYVEMWGRPESSARLKKLADTLAALCRNAKRRGPSMDVAVSHWEEDLDWLKEEYYRAQFRFRWPSH